MEIRDFNARDLIVKKLNELLKKYVAIPYDNRESHHYSILIFEQRKGWPAERYLEGFESGFVEDVDLQNTDFPEDREIQDLIDGCYNEMSDGVENVVKDADEPVTCPACDGEGVLLGALGFLTHYRCPACGMDFSR